jgi:hypothetical protein
MKEGNIGNIDITLSYDNFDIYALHHLNDFK